MLLNKFLTSRFGSVYVFAMVFLLASLALRTALLISCAAHIDSSPAAVARTYLAGFLMDGVTFFYLMIPVTLFAILAPNKLFQWKVNRVIAFATCCLAICFVLFDVTAEWFFWDEFQVRYNFVAVNYLVYTQEVVGNIRESYPVTLIFAGMASATILIALAIRKPFFRSFQSADSLKQRLAPGMIFLAVPVLAYLFVNPTTAIISPNNYNNELAKNGLYSIVTAFGENKIDYDHFYLTLEDKTVFERMRHLLATPNSRFVSNDVMDLTREITAPRPEKHPNVVVLVIESLSGEFLGSFGNKFQLTPNLDALAKQSLLFRNFYATGTRTDRGLEALTLSIPPTPGRSMVKRPANKNMFSIGQIFGRRGYQTKFIYGGSNRFDNMGSFFQSNGFACIEQDDFAPSEITFANAWGVCDEDLFNRVLRECDKSFSAGKPFFSMVMSTSNHRPFTFPPGKVGDLTGRKAGVRYTDLAIGQFLQQAKAKPWFDNTVFVVVADHCASSAGKTQVPVVNYRIPLFIYAPKIITPQLIAQLDPKLDNLGGQIDFAPTLLGLLDFSYRTKFFGRDIFQIRPENPGRALMGNYDTVGLYQDNKLGLLMLQPMQSSKTYSIGPANEQREAPDDGKIIFDAISYYQSASHLLEQHHYKAD